MIELKIELNSDKIQPQTYQLNNNTKHTSYNDSTKKTRKNCEYNAIFLKRY